MPEDPVFSITPTIHIFSYYSLFWMCLKCSCDWWTIRICPSLPWGQYADVDRCRGFFGIVVTLRILPIIIINEPEKPME